MESTWVEAGLAYASPQRGENTELPFRLLVLGDFSSSHKPKNETRSLKPVSVSRENFNLVLQELCGTLDFDVIDAFTDDVESRLSVSLPMRELNDFNPAQLLNNVPTLRAADELATQLASSETHSLSEEANALLQMLNRQDSLEDSSTRQLLIAELRERMACQLDALLHDSEFQRLEAAWRGLKLMVDQTDDSSCCQISMISVDKISLAQDFELSSDVTDSWLYNITYIQEFGQFGGEPYGAIIADYAFGPSESDVTLARQLSKVASICHAPLIAAADPTLLGVKTFQDTAGIRSLDELHRGARYFRWRSFQDEPNARYMALALPRLLLRDRYQLTRGVTGGISYSEKTLNHSERLWGNPAFALAARLINAFQKHRMCVDIIGPDAGRIEGLEMISKPCVGDAQLPVEIVISERRESEIANLGLIPLTVLRGQHIAAFYSANTVRWGGMQRALLAGDDFALGDKLGAQLPYIFLISRLAHYIKVIQRDNIGTVKTPNEIQAELTNWLRNYVSDVENPAAAVRARRPLRKIELRVTPPSGNSPWYQMSLHVTPHMKYMGSSFSLGVDGQLGHR